MPDGIEHSLAPGQLYFPVDDLLSEIAVVTYDRVQFVSLQRLALRGP